MSDALGRAALQRARKASDELNELRRKTKHQEGLTPCVYSIKDTPLSFKFKIVAGKM